MTVYITTAQRLTEGYPLLNGTVYMEDWQRIQYSVLLRMQIFGQNPR